MSKEMLVIVLGVLVLLTRTVLGVPGEWQTVILVAVGVALCVTGFLLRGEALSRGGGTTAKVGRSYSFVESLPDRNTPQPTPAHAETHEHKEGITSLN